MRSTGFVPRRRPRWGTLALVVLLHLAALAGLMRVFAPDFTARVVEEAGSLVSVTITAPPEPEPVPEAPAEPAPEPADKVSRRAARREERERRKRAKESERRRAPREAPVERQRGGVIGFLASCWAELKRVQWPDRETLIQASAITLIFIAVMAAYLGVLDVAFNWLVQRIL